MSIARALKPAVLLAFIAMLVAFVLVPANTARADEIDTAVDAATIIGVIAGVQLTQEEADLVKGLVRCFLVQRVTMAACARGFVVTPMRDKFGPQAAAFAQCFWDGKDMATCGSDQFINQLPEPIRPVARCLTTHPDVGACASDAAQGTGWRSYLDTIDKFKADGRSEVENAGSGAVRNIIAIAEGIREDDWLKVSIAAGTEVYKAAGKIVLYAVLPFLEVARPVLDPLVDAIIQERSDALTDIIKGVKAGDPGVIADVLVEVYIKETYLIGCKLQAVPGIPHEIFDATCGNLSKVIRALGTTAGDIANALFDLIKDPLHIPQNLWHDITGVINDARHLAAGKVRNCQRPEYWYAENYGLCLGRGAVDWINPAGDQLFKDFNERIYGACRAEYIRCYFPDEVDDICIPMFNTFIDQTGAYSNALVKGADSIRRSFRRYMSAPWGANGRIPPRCQSASQFDGLFAKFSEEECAVKLEAKPRLDVDPPQGNFGINTGQCRHGGAESPFRSACNLSMAGLDKNRLRGELCRPPQPGAPQNCRGHAQCGLYTVKCDNPMPRADWYGAMTSDEGKQSGGPTWHPSESTETVTNQRLTGTVQEDLDIPSIEHTMVLHLCAYNAGGFSCSNSFSVTFPACRLRDPPDPPEITCPQGYTKCSRPFVGCYGPNDPLPAHCHGDP